MSWVVCTPMSSRGEGGSRHRLSVGDDHRFSLLQWIQFTHILSFQTATTSQEGQPSDSALHLRRRDYLGVRCDRGQLSLSRLRDGGGSFG